MEQKGMHLCLASDAWRSTVKFKFLYSFHPSWYQNFLVHSYIKRWQSWQAAYGYWHVNGLIFVFGQYLLICLALYCTIWISNIELNHVKGHKTTVNILKNPPIFLLCSFVVTWCRTYQSSSFVRHYQTSQSIKRTKEQDTPLHFGSFLKEKVIQKQFTLELKNRFETLGENLKDTIGGDNIQRGGLQYSLHIQ